MDLDRTGIVERLDIYVEENGERVDRARVESIIGEIKILVNNLPQREIVPSRLYKLEEFNGYPIHDGRIPLRFAETHFDDKAQGFALAWGTANMDQFTLQVPISSDALGSVRLRLRRAERPGNAALGNIVTTRTTQVDVTDLYKEFSLEATEFFGAGGKSQRRTIHGLHMFTDKIVDIEVWRGSEVLIKQITKQELDEYYEEAGYFPQSDMFHLVPHALIGLLGDQFILQSGDIKFPLKLKMNLAAGATTFDMLVQELGPRI
ncbi:hypothetical protein GCM10007972_27650 [Iodidimonas muriae]|uniref:Viral coat protein P2 N-terminal domain-containing protein n=2 Tax=Iodidimonas muriae TaxID=261467 RepID=A0ABQ2LGH8_9PROT|nr:hypothetical protein JCM17843_31160 [Kordiimonadales bacterium JCM 17843]GGO17512.1 hypothetical protein GCM10007972_27650 [Iodidimonas muriae]